MAKPTKAATRGARTNLSLPGDLRARLQAERVRSGAPLAEIIRRAIDAYLTPREQAARKAGGR
jgi:predicted DNA-binding protein